ncbi:MAG TPA: ACT domain-containing protein, partial [Actinomycetota bacterium]|nr:ACT domain-containing protein [Actinomycetota bacterium]
DLGKGQEGDHAEIGAQIVARIGTRLGFAAADVDLLAGAVRLHLLLPNVATSRDLDDPVTVERVAEAVGSPELLRLLAALTEADSLATGPSAWGHWKAGLVRSLVDRTDAFLRGEIPEGGASGEGFPSPRQLERLAAGGQLIEAGGHVLTVMDDDRPGMFSRVAGVLAMHGLDVLAAAAYSSEDGRALSEFRVSAPPGGDAGGAGWSRVVADLRRALSGRLAVHARVLNRARTYARTRPVSRVEVEPAVTVDNDASQEATVIDVHAPDAVGTLYRITRALADFDLDIRRARVRTLGAEVVDSFYVRGAGGQKVTDAALLAELERAILHNLAE